MNGAKNTRFVESTFENRTNLARNKVLELIKENHEQIEITTPKKHSEKAFFESSERRLFKDVRLLQNWESERHLQSWNKVEHADATIINSA